jgi:hypothetical protein
MRRAWRSTWGAALVFTCAVVPVVARSAEPLKPAISPEALRLLGDMSDYLKAAPQLSFHADITHDDLLPTGQKLQLGATYEAAIRRPDRVFTDYSGDVDRRRLWYDGKTITLYDPVLDVYATESAKSTIDATVQHLITQLGFTPPLSDLMTSDPGATLRKNVAFGFVVGTTQIDGALCHHLAFVEPTIDWQIWIEDGTQVVPHRIVITYVTQPEAPQFQATFSDWTFGDRLIDAQFQPQIPPGTGKIEFLPSAVNPTEAPAPGKASGAKK